MNVLQIWLGSNKPSKIMMGYMKNIFSSMKEADTYTLISSLNLFPKNKKVNWINSDKYIKEMLSDIDKSIIDLWDYLNGEIFEYIYKSDIIRLYYLSKNEDVLYLDTDIELKDFPIFLDKVYMARRSLSLVNHCIFYNGTNKEFSMRLLKEATFNSFNVIGKTYNCINIYWILKLLDKYINEIIAIDESFFVHHREL
jgi:hypothetical protein